MLVAIGALFGNALPAAGHEPTLGAFLAQQAKKESAERESRQKNAARPQCDLSIRLTDPDTKKGLYGLVRVIDLDTFEKYVLGDLVSRDEGWHVVPETAQVKIPRARVRIEAVAGLEHEADSVDLDLREKETASASFHLKQFYSAASKSLRAGNTHVHLRRMSRTAADRYMRQVPRADQLDVVFISYLDRPSENYTYISNEYRAESLRKLQPAGKVYGWGEEHRHNFTPWMEGYGHVMFLDLKKLVEPVSIGVGIPGAASDGRTIRRGIVEAREQGATVIWCHNRFGLEDVPNWVAGMVDAHNINDGSDHGPYEDTYYKYLNVGLKVPFSTGTDWFIFDFSRVYVPVEKELTTARWLAGLRAGRSYITNGPLLEFSVAGKQLGNVLELSADGKIKISEKAIGRKDSGGADGKIKMSEKAVGRKDSGGADGKIKMSGKAIGRNDFRSLEVVFNGRVIREVECRQQDGHWKAAIDTEIEIDEPGWIALRIPWNQRMNEFKKYLFAHTSPIYITKNGRHRFDPKTAGDLIREMERAIRVIRQKGKFASPQEQQQVLSIYLEGIETLKKRAAQAKSR